LLKGIDIGRKGLGARGKIQGKASVHFQGRYVKKVVQGPQLGGEGGSVTK